MIAEEPENFTGFKGETAIYTVIAEGEGLTYQWQVNKDGTWRNATFDGAQTATLSVEIMTSRNGFKFRCIVKDVYGVTVTSNEAYLKVVSEPVVESNNSGFKNEIDINDVDLPSNTVVSEPANCADTIDVEETVDPVETTTEAVEETVVTEIDIVEEVS